MFKWLRRLLRWWRQRRNLKRFAGRVGGHSDPGESDGGSCERGHADEAPNLVPSLTPADPTDQVKAREKLKARIKAAKHREYRGAQCETCKGKLRTAAYTYQRWCSKRCRVIARHAGKSENPNRRIQYEMTTKGRRIMRVVLNA